VAKISSAGTGWRRCACLGCGVTNRHRRGCSNTAKVSRRPRVGLCSVSRIGLAVIIGAGDGRRPAGIIGVGHQP